MLKWLMGFGPPMKGKSGKRLKWKWLKNWSGKRDLNPRPSPWQGDALPLSYSRSPDPDPTTWTLRKCGFYWPDWWLSTLERMWHGNWWHLGNTINQGCGLNANSNFVLRTCKFPHSNFFIYLLFLPSGATQWCYRSNKPNSTGNIDKFIISHCFYNCF